MVELPTIPEFFRNKTIFITGGSGFIGKVLEEKLLRSCPDLKTIYLLLREKKGLAPEDRIKTIILRTGGGGGGLKYFLPGHVLARI
ncbi:hypothetical protein Zmor_017218 [Zophobas morio]|uniref:Fatty acyl-CoA reductase n=1 Tax=Zophobas morio TaxID=2755281 RepID=A0AA38IC55_9CUCU|nr:hypothetical protein Zmor_017218 [Zophobas morio]